MTPLFLAPGLAWERSRSADQRKRLGQWPTPWWLVQSVLDRVLAQVPRGGVVMDPACGDGRWLAAVGVRRPDARLVGWDLDPDAVAVAQAVCAAAGVTVELSCRDALRGDERHLADLVVGNPPFIRPQNLDAATRAYVWRRFGVMTDKADLYAAFLERMVELSKPGPARVAVVVGDTWVSMASYAALRDHLWDVGIRLLVPLPSGTFAARVGTVAMVLGTGRRQLGALQDGALKARSPLRRSQGIVLLQDAPELVGQGTLGDHWRLRMGVVCGSYREFVHTGPRGALDQPTCRGRDVQPWSIADRGEWVRYAPREMLDRRPYVAPKTRALFDVPAKVVLAGASGRQLRAAVDTARRFPLDSCYVSQGDGDVWALAGLLNSATVNAWYGARFPAARVKAVELATVPWPRGPLDAVGRAARAQDQAAVDVAVAQAYTC